MYPGALAIQEFLRERRTRLSRPMHLPRRPQWVLWNIAAQLEPLSSCPFPTDPLHHLAQAPRFADLRPGALWDRRIAKRALQWDAYTLRPRGDRTELHMHGKLRGCSPDVCRGLPVSGWDRSRVTCRVVQVEAHVRLTLNPLRPSSPHPPAWRSTVALCARLAKPGRAWPAPDA